MRGAVWRWRISSKRKPNGRLDTEAVPFPFACADCPTEQRTDYGCGYDEAAIGKARVQYKGALGELRTCPQWLYHEIPIAYWTLTNLEDYRRGALGNVLDLDADLLDYLRVADSEMGAWRDAMEAQIADGNSTR